MLCDSRVFKRILLLEPICVALRKTRKLQLVFEGPQVLVPGSQLMAEMSDYWLYSMNAPFGPIHDKFENV